MKRVVLLFSVILIFISCDTGTGSTPESPYRVTFEVWANTADRVSTTAYIRDDEDNRYYGGKFYLSGLEMEFASPGFYYLVYSFPWKEGVARSYEFELPGDDPVKGDLTRPVGTLEGITYVPARPAVANHYSLSPPGGVWRENSVIECHITKDSETTVIRQFPEGAGDYVFTSPDLLDADRVDFYSLLMDEEIPGYYAGGSFVRFYGTKTSW